MSSWTTSWPTTVLSSPTLLLIFMSIGKLFALNSFISFVKNKISSRGKILQKSDDSYFRLNKVITRVYCQGRSELSFKIRVTVMIEFDKILLKLT